MFRCHDAIIFSGRRIVSSRILTIVALNDDRSVLVMQIITANKAALITYGTLTDKLLWRNIKMCINLEQCLNYKVYSPVCLPLTDFIW